VLVFALRNFKCPCQISKGGGTFLICGKLVEGRDITREGKSTAVMGDDLRGVRVLKEGLISKFVFAEETIYV